MVPQWHCGAPTRADGRMGSRDRPLLCRLLRQSFGFKMLATASMDKKIKLWNCDQGRNISALVGHNAQVTSVDFHPVHPDILCSSDGEGELRYWKLNNASSATTCTGNLKVASKTIRQALFNPVGGKQIAVLETTNTHTRAVAMGVGGAHCDACSRRSASRWGGGYRGAPERRWAASVGDCDLRWRFGVHCSH